MESVVQLYRHRSVGAFSLAVVDGANTAWNAVFRMLASWCSASSSTRFWRVCREMSTDFHNRWNAAPASNSASSHIKKSFVKQVAILIYTAATSLLLGCNQILGCRLSPLRHPGF